MKATMAWRCHACGDFVGGVRALIEDETARDKGVADTIKDHKRNHDDDEDDHKEDPPAGPNQGSKTDKSTSAKEPVEEPTGEVVMDDAGKDMVCNDDQPQDTSEPKTINTLNPEWFTQPLRSPTPDPEWNKRQDPLTFNDLMATPINFSKSPGHRTVAADYFFNNDLEYLKSFDPERTYTTSITKTKEAWYEIEGIKDMVPTLLIPTKVGVKKMHGYGHLEEIVVKRADCQLYKFKEGNFVDLHINDIEHILLLVVQHKLFHLTDSDIVDFIVALRMLTRSLVIKKRVEDLQLGVESYQKKLYLTDHSRNRIQRTLHFISQTTRGNL
ncbi:hypothetical protein Tco_0671735 [Tanacetum coccineum]